MGVRGRVGAVVASVALVACGGPSPEQREACGQLRDFTDRFKTTTADLEGFQSLTGVMDDFASAANRTDDAELRSAARDVRAAWVEFTGRLDAVATEINEAKERVRQAQLFGNSTSEQIELKNLQDAAAERLKASSDRLAEARADAMVACEAAGVPLDVAPTEDQT